MVCELRVIILAEGAVCIIDYGDGGDGSAVRRNGREGKERLIKLIGDVLAGMCAALIAEKESAFYTASIAAFLHGVAGDKAAKARGERNMIAGDIIEELKGLLT